EPEPELEAPEPEPELEAPEPEPELEAPEPEPTPESEPTPEQPSNEASDSTQKSEDRDVIFVGTKPIMTYVSATLTQLSTRQTVTIKARGKRITQAVDVSQMIVKRMDSVGYVVSDVRISSDSLTSQDGKQRNVSTIEIDISKN
ncbi:MAG: DNA-binding protein, partial [Nitrosopumilus sp.]